jgi:hypothetical protein
MPSIGTRSRSSATFSRDRTSSATAKAYTWFRRKRFVVNSAASARVFLVVRIAHEGRLAHP